MTALEIAIEAFPIAQGASSYEAVNIEKRRRKLVDLITEHFEPKQPVTTHDIYDISDAD